MSFASDYHHLHWYLRMYWEVSSVMILFLFLCFFFPWIFFSNHVDKLNILGLIIVSLLTMMFMFFFWISILKILYLHCDTLLKRIACYRFWRTSYYGLSKILDLGVRLHCKWVAVFFCSLIYLVANPCV